MSNVRFNYADVSPVTLRRKREVKEAVARLFKEEGRKVSLVHYIFCSDDFLLNINRSFLQHDYLTDIITFDLSENSSSVTSEIYISIQRVRENAVAHHVSYTNELLRVIFHGALHLCGYKDKKKSEITVMRQKEEYYLRLFEQK